MSKPRIMSPEVRLSLILLHTAEGASSDWPEEYMRRGVQALLDTPDGADINDVHPAEVLPSATDDFDGLTDVQIVSLIASYHFG